MGQGMRGGGRGGFSGRGRGRGGGGGMGASMMNFGGGGYGGQGTLCQHVAHIILRIVFLRRPFWALFSLPFVHLLCKQDVTGGFLWDL